MAVVARSGGSTEAAGPRGRRLQAVLFVLALVALAAATAVGYLVLRDRDADRLEDEEASVAARSAGSTETLVAGAAAALAGADAIVDDTGAVDVGAFARFGAGVVDTGTTDAVLLLTVVDGPDRAAFEAAVAPITTVGAGGARSAAAPADAYYPITAVVPAAAAGDILGIDFLSDDDRGAAMELAAADQTTVVSDPVELTTTGERGALVVRPLPGAAAGGPALAGFVASSLAVDDVVDALSRSLPAGTEVAISDGDTLLGASGDPTGSRSRTATAELPGQEWRITTELPADELPSAAVLVLVAGSALWLALLVLFVVTIRHQRRLRTTNRSLAVAEQRSRTLEVLATRLSRSLSGADVAGALLESLHGLTGATGGAVSVRSDDGDQLELVSAAGYPDDADERLARVPIEAGTILHGVITTGEATYLPSPLRWRDDVAASRFAGIGMAAAIVPLVDGGDVRGVLVVSQPSVRRFSPEERSLLETIGALAGRALARSLRYDVEHATSSAFQAASVPAVLPPTQGLAVAARYRPATSRYAVGGDWYDVVALPDGRVAVVVGDVVGHGVTAAAVMGHLRSAVRVLSGALTEPAALMRALTAEVASIPNAIGATMAYGVVDPGAGSMHYVLAGHPPPLLLPADGGARLLDGTPWPPLGVMPADNLEVPGITLAPGDTVLLYTDGVIERRGESLVVGLERLRAAGAELGDLVPDDLCDALLEAIVPSDDQSDDVAIVAIRLLAHVPGAIDLTDAGPEPEPAEPAVVTRSLGE